MNLFLSSFIFFISLSANAYFFDKAVVQYAGDIGKISFGIEKEVKDYYWLSFHFGMTPSTDTTRKHQTYTTKNSFKLFSYEKFEVLYQLYAGAGIFYIPDDHYKTDDIDGTPDSYYRQSSFRGILYLGHNFNFLEKHSAYFEGGVNDVWIIALSNNRKLNFIDHLTLSLGYKYKL